MSQSAIPDPARRRRPHGKLGAPRRVVLALVLTLAVLAPQRAQSSGRDEYQQKASLICNFLRQCKWPERRFASPSSPFIIGIQGADTIGDYLRENTQGRLIQGRSVQIRRITSRQELEVCHLVFVSRSERDRLRSILGETRRENVLTVGECDNFLASGGVIQFVNFGGQVRYRISLEAARRERIEPSGFVLRLSLPPSAARHLPERRPAATS